MIKIFVDGKEFNAKPGQTIIEAMKSNGLKLPHFCWHPKLSISGNCRMCLVEVGMPKLDSNRNEEFDSDGNVIVNYAPKLQIGCATPIAEGMRISASSEKVLKARKYVMEFILINHPLDCPICDEAGECKLQDYAYNHSVGKSRFDEEKQHKPKRINWSEKILYDAERCIMCSRCIRFAEEVADNNVLTFKNRGDKVYIEVEEGKKYDNPYSMNVIDICPVGALTSADFRFRSRVWDMSFGDSISPNDSTGSNITIGTKQNKILRIKPQKGNTVNGHWITDDVRLNYSFVNENRLLKPACGKSSKKNDVSWDELNKLVIENLKKFKPNEIFFLLSPLATIEDNKALLDLALKIGSNKIGYLEHIDPNAIEDGNLLVKDKSPNLNGLKFLGLNNGNYLSAKKMPELVHSKEIKAIYILEEDFRFNEDILNGIKKAELIISHCYNKNSVWEASDIVAATSTFAEIYGTYINKDNISQKFKPVLITQENLSRSGMKLGRLDAFGAQNDRWNHYEIPDSRQSLNIISNIADKI